MTTARDNLQTSADRLETYKAFLQAEIAALKEQFEAQDTETQGTNTTKFPGIRTFLVNNSFILPLATNTFKSLLSQILLVNNVEIPGLEEFKVSWEMSQGMRDLRKKMGISRSILKVY